MKRINCSLFIYFQLNPAVQYLPFVLLFRCISGADTAVRSANRKEFFVDIRWSLPANTVTGSQVMPLTRL
jgi:hypothetical protein